MNTDEIAQALCCASFVESLERACLSAGGGSYDSLKDRTLQEVMHILAPNGIRFVCSTVGRIEASQDMAHIFHSAQRFLEPVTPPQ